MKKSLLLLAAFLFVTFSILSAAPRSASALEPYTTCRGEEVTISATLLQNGTYGDPVANQDIEFFDETNNHYLGSSRTDSFGTCALPWLIPMDYRLGIVTVNATFRGNTTLFLAPSSVSLNLHILSATEIQINQSYVTAAFGDEVEISTRLTNDEGLPIFNGVLNVRIDNQTILSYTTNVSGYADFVLSCNTSWLALGENRLSVNYEWNPTLHMASCTSELTIHIVEIEASLDSIGEPPDTVSLGSSIPYNLVLSSPEGPLSNSLIRIMLDGNQIAEATTNPQGNASVEIEVDARFTLGPHALGFHYDGSNRYSATQSIFSLTVTTSAHLSVYLPAEIILNTITAFDVNVVDNLGRSIPGIGLSLNDSASDVVTTEYLQDERGNFTIEILILGPSGNRTMYIQVLPTAFVDVSTIEMEVTVWSKPFLSMDFSNIMGYSTPGQNVVVEVRLTDSLGNLTNRAIIAQLNTDAQDVLLTDARGVLRLTFEAPHLEQVHILSLRYLGNDTRYELGCEFDFVFAVTRIIPVILLLDEYEVISPLRQIRTRLSVLGLNGSLINGISVEFSWQSISFNRVSSSDGTIVLHLGLPNHDGIFLLNYSIDSTETIDGTHGSLVISVTRAQVDQSQGLGIPLISIALIASLIVVAVPTIARRFLV